MSGASEVNPKPLFWEPDKALNFPDIYYLISQYHPQEHPVSREIIACIFFEETGFCNRRQRTKKGFGPAVGFGQMEIDNPDKEDFFKWMGIPKPSPDAITINNELSVQISCKYFQWLVSVHGKSVDGALSAQTGGGGNESFVPLFKEGGKRLRDAIYSSDKREDYVRALNYARTNGIHKNGIPYKDYRSFWEFVIPEQYLALGGANEY